MMYNLFLLGMGLIYIYSMINMKLEYVKFFIFLLLISTIIFGLLLLKQYLNKKNPTRCFNYIQLLIITTFYMMGITLMNMYLGIGTYSLSTIVQDIISMIFLCGGFLLTDKRMSNDKVLINYLKIIGIIGLGSGIIAIFMADFSNGRTGNGWKPQYILWGFLFPWSYLLLYKLIVKSKNTLFTLITYGNTILYIILGLLFGKRMVIFEAMIILFLIVLTKKIRFMKKDFIRVINTIVLSVCLIFLGQQLLGFSFTTLLSSTLTRFNGLSLSNFDRFDEFFNVLKYYPVSTLITGSGLGSFQNGPGGINLHIGWLNYVYKGGIIFLLIELWILMLSVYIFFRTKDLWHKFLSACVIFIYFSILIGSSWVPMPTTLHFSVMKFALLRISADYKINIRNIFKIDNQLKDIKEST